MENSTKEILALIMWSIMIWMLCETRHIIAKKWHDYFNPFNEYDWLDKNLGKKVLIEDTVNKGRGKLEGTLEAVFTSKNKRDNKKPGYDLRINTGGRNAQYVPINSKWEFKDAKNRP